MKKIRLLIYILIVINIFSNDKNRLIELYNRETPLNIEEIVERDMIIRKAIIDKKIKLLEYVKLKEKDRFEYILLRNLFVINDKKLYDYFEKKSFIKDDTIKFSLYAFIKNNETINYVYEKNTVGNIIVKDPIYEEDESLIEKCFHHRNLAFLEIVLKKMNKNKEELDTDFLKRNWYSSFDEGINLIKNYQYKDEKQFERNLFIYYFNKYDYRDEELLNEALEIYESNPDIVSDYRSFSFLFDIAISQKRYDLAKEFYQNSEEKSIKKLVKEMIITNNTELRTFLEDLDIDINRIIVDIVEESIFTNDLKTLENILKSEYPMDIEKNYNENLEIRNYALYVAIRANNMEAIKLLKKYGKLNFYYGTEELYAIEKENSIEILNYILENGNIDTNYTLTSEKGPYFSINNLDILRMLLLNDRGDEVRKAFLAGAVLNNNIKVLYFILEDGVSSKKQKNNLLYSFLEWDKDFDRTNLDILKIFKENGVDFNDIKEKKSALIYSIEKEDTKLLKYLLNMGVDINYKDSKGYSASDYVKMSKNKEIKEIYSRGTKKQK